MIISDNISSGDYIFINGYNYLPEYVYNERKNKNTSAVKVIVTFSSKYEVIIEYNNEEYELGGPYLRGCAITFTDWLMQENEKTLLTDWEMEQFEDLVPEYFI